MATNKFVLARPVDFVDAEGNNLQLEAGDEISLDKEQAEFYKNGGYLVESKSKSRSKSKSESESPSEPDQE